MTAFGVLLVASGDSPSGETPEEYPAAIEATSALQGFRLRSELQTRSSNTGTEIVVSGSNASIAIRLISTSENRLVDGRYYELDGDRWHLKPAPARSLVPPTDLAEFTDDLRALPAFEIDRNAESLTLRLACGSDDRARAGRTVERLCDDRIETDVVINLDTGLLSRVESEGDFELFPGRYETGSEVVEIEPLAATEAIEVPDSFYVERAGCISERLGTADYVEMSLLIEDFTTAENSDLFTTCGFEFYPAGTDFRDD
ncbi:MAG: hypothetical protein AAGA65_27290 [Actinomycetota bacterium]